MKYSYFILCVLYKVLSRRTISLPDPSGTYSLDLKTLFNPLPEKLLVKIMKNGIVLDEAILTDVNNLPVSRIVSWNLY
jgi:hypothetical protein